MAFGQEVIYERGCQNKQRKSYNDLQNEIGGVISSVQKLIQEPDFIEHVKTDGLGMANIDEKLQLWKEDLMERDCAIVFAGETSSGKSTILNSIIGKPILPVRHEAATQKVCRIRYSDELSVSLCNTAGHTVEKMAFKNTQEMKTTLPNIICDNGSDIKYVDIWYPVEILKGNDTCVIVDTPGIGDQEQENVAQIMMEYLPNALAFVFVVNTQSGDGLQDDRINRIFDRVERSRDNMVSFDPRDAIFLLNKWDSLIFSDDEPEEVVFNNILRKLKKLWGTVTERNVLKFAAGRIDSSDFFRGQFEKFNVLLNDIAFRMETGRVKQHLQLLEDEFFRNCEATLCLKQKMAYKTETESTNELRTHESELNGLDNIRKRAMDIPNMVDQFLKEATEQLFQFIYSIPFREAVLNDIRKYSRPRVGSVLDSRIKSEILTWERENIPRIMQATILDKITKSFTSIHQSLDKIKQKMSGIDTPFDINNKIKSVLTTIIAPSGTGIVASVVLKRLPLLVLPANAFIAISVLGSIAISAAVALDYREDFDMFCLKSFLARKDALSKTEIRAHFHKMYAKQIEHLITTFLDGDLKDDIDRHQRLVKTLQFQNKADLEKIKALEELMSRISKLKMPLSSLK